MSDALFWHRLQFGFTITYHYLFPQLTMGLALLIVVFKVAGAPAPASALYDDAARFWARIFGINFAVGVVTGIPMEFQFGTNWARFSQYAGGVIGQTLAMEGMFAFFVESTFLGLFLFGEKRLGPRAHLAAAVALVRSAPGSPATSSSPPTPSCSTRSGTRSAPTAARSSPTCWAYPLQPVGALAVRAHHDRRGGHRRPSWSPAVGAYWTLCGTSPRSTPRSALRIGVIAGLDRLRAAALPHRRPARQAGGRAPAGRRSRRWRGSSTSEPGAELAIIGQPERGGAPARQPDRACPACSASSPTARFGATVDGPRTTSRATSGRTTSSCSTTPTTSWSGLGTIFIALMALARAAALARTPARALARLLWVLMLAVPVPVHRDHRRLDDRRARPPALARLRPDAHRGRHLAARHGRATRSSPLSASWASTWCSASSSCSWWAGRSRTGRARRTPGRPGCGRRSPGRAGDGSALVRARRRDARGLRGARRLRLRRRHPAPVRGAGPTPSAGRCSPPSGRSGTATRSGSSPAAGCSSSRFPRAYAVGFSGFYLPLMLVLWLLILRGISIEFRTHVRRPALARVLGRRSSPSAAR